MDGKIQRARLALLFMRNARVIYTIGSIGVAIIAFLISITDINQMQPPFGGGGSATAVVV
jgi:hypothetical protein